VIYFYFGTKHTPNYFFNGFTVYIKRSCSEAPIDTVTIGGANDLINYTIGVSGQLF
jgi:hypothetical protein